MYKILIALLLTLAIPLTQYGCGGSGGDGAGGEGAGGSDDDGGGGGGGGSGVLVEPDPASYYNPRIIANNVRNPGTTSTESDKIILKNYKSEKFGDLTIAKFDLPEGLTNARENTNTVRTIGRTAMRVDGDDAVKVPIRSYIAHCKDNQDQENIFVSMSLQKSGSSAADRVGSVMQLKYNKSSNAYESASNEVVLHGACEETHGVAVSPDCSRVAVLCQNDYGASKKVSFSKDIAASSRSTRFNLTDSGWEEMWLLEWDRNEKLSGSYQAYVIAKNVVNRSSSNLLYVENDTEGRTSYAFTAETHDTHHSAAAQFVINRTDKTGDKWSIDLYNGGTETGRGWDWDCVKNRGHDFMTRTFYNPHTQRYSSLCTSDWTGAPGPGSMGGGVIGTVGIRSENSSFDISYYVPANSSPMLNGGGHTAVVVDKDNTMLAIAAPQLVTPSAKELYAHSSKVTNYINRNLTDPNTAVRISKLGLDLENLTNDEMCALYWEGDEDLGCDKAIYLSATPDEGFAVPNDIPIDIYINNLEPSIGLWEQALDPRFYTRVGVRMLDGYNEIKFGQGMKWIAGDVWDIDYDGNVVVDGDKVGDGTGDTVVSCTYGDPQLVDLQNGRYLMGYAKYICSDHKFTSGSKSQEARFYGKIGGIAMMFPQAYYLVELDAEGNIQEGPVELEHDTLGAIGWGALDQMIPLGNGKAGWVYKNEPTLDHSNIDLSDLDPDYPSPVTNEWRMMVYESEFNSTSNSP